MDTFEQSAGRIAAAMGSVARSEAPKAPIMLGRILQAQPLLLEANGLAIEQDSIQINEAMVEGYSPKLEGSLTGSCPDGTTVTPVKKDDLSRGEFALKAGDLVVVMSPDAQTYYILCKVVSL